MNATTRLRLIGVLQGPVENDITGFVGHVFFLSDILYQPVVKITRVAVGERRNKSDISNQKVLHMLRMIWHIV